MVEFVLVEVLNALIDEDSIFLAKTFGKMPYEERMELAVLAGLYANPGSALKLRRFWADLKLIPQSTRA
uniref:Uncharacterized protein n=1 Tax=Chromera velia CCMP2878 TaxID=1169474 RepID=A0A0G4H346_9ALVE|eukprot:Cvel_24434.t1-p1 / transcript=Cvel_24434.t1 / gene=Cvel_24434 / organism=Chromera_velia_CCMP2878 / gene_product=hypothetical protein / transcript_product=hypothetical protein / location=Cvel_scaffold2640:24062-24265(-) / protein_length=68 / sequence_SO=supercontig / SO=protein_coding / is_pseudo=false